MPKKRSQYRVRPPSQSRILELGLRFKGEDVPCQAMDMSARGMCVHVTRKSDPGFSEKDVLHLQIKSNLLDRELFVPCKILRCEPITNGTLYGLEILDWLGLTSALPPKLARVFNQRVEFRLELAPEEKMPVIVEGLHLELTGELQDLSSGGMSFLVPSNMETVLLNHPHLTVSFRPGGEKLTFSGTIVHRQVKDDGFCVGLMFEEERTEEFNKNKNLLIKFLRERQRELLKVCLGQRG